MTKLKPCPFCGGEAHVERMGTDRQSCSVECGNCGARHESSDEYEMSGTSWNERHAASPADLQGEDARDAARFRGIMDTLVAVMNEQPLTPAQEKMHGMLDSMEVGTITVDHVRAAIDAAMSASKEGASD